MLGKVEIHARERLTFWEHMSSRIEETLTVMEDIGDGNIKCCSRNSEGTI
jgi:hypothetical protein